MLLAAYAASRDYRAGGRGRCIRDQRGANALREQDAGRGRGLPVLRDRRGQARRQVRRERVERRG